MRLPGELAKAPARAHSFVMLGAVLAETDALDRASSMGDGAGRTLSGTEGLLSGVLMGGVNSFDVGWLLPGKLLLLLLLLLLWLLLLLLPLGGGVGTGQPGSP